MSTGTIEKKSGVRQKIDDLLVLVQQKKADEGGETAHPVGKAPDDTQSAPEGSHATELAKVEREGFPSGVGSSTANDTGSVNQDAENLQNTGKETGTDPSVEDDYKMTPDDPGTSHPARVDKESAPKFASKQDELAAVMKQAEKIAEQFLARATAELREPEAKEAAAAPATPAAEAGKEAAAEPAKTEPAAAADPAEKKADEQAGQDLAQAAANMNVPPTDKQANDEAVFGYLGTVIGDAISSAEKVAQYLASYKQAEDEEKKEPSGESEGGEGGGDKGGGSPPPAGEGPAMGGGGGAGGGVSEQDLMALMAGGDAMGAPSMDQMGMGGGGAGAGAGAGGMGGGDATAILDAVCQELGITMDQLRELVNSVPPSGGDMGGAMGGGAMGGGMGSAAPPMKAAAAKPDPKQAALKSAMFQFVRELLNKK